jgi:ribulose-phosphate 3-epimerase
MSIKIAPSILASDFANLETEVKRVNNSGAEWIHIDVMDGVFVPNISFGMPVLKAIGNHAELPLDVHLMIVDPDRFLEEFRDLNSHVLTVHYEACQHLHRTVQRIRGLGMKAGVSLNPHTPIHGLEYIANDLDLVLIMSVNPGFGGQSFIESTYKKVEDLVALRNRNSANFLIEIDGGVGPGNAQKLAESGADVLVAGSSVFKHENLVQAVASLR